MKTRKNIVYGVFRNDEAIYVGITSRLDKRKQEHRSRFGRDIEFRILATPDDKEAIWIRKLKPKYNKLKTGEPVPRKPGSRKRGPKTKPDSQKYLHPLLMRFRHQDRRLLNSAAKAEGMAVSVYIREAALTLARREIAER